MKHLMLGVCLGNRRTIIPYPVQLHAVGCQFFMFRSWNKQGGTIPPRFVGVTHVYVRRIHIVDVVGRIQRGSQPP